MNDKLINKLFPQKKNSSKQKFSFQFPKKNRIFPKSKKKKKHFLLPSSDDIIRIDSKHKPAVYLPVRLITRKRSRGYVSSICPTLLIRRAKEEGGGRV